MSGILGLRGTGNFGTDERPKNFREMILFRDPNGDAPIFAMTSKLKKRTVDDPEFSWWDEPQDLVRLQVAGALLSTDTTVVVDSVDPSASAPGLNYGTATHLKAGDLLLVEPADDAAAFSPEVIEVVTVLSDTSFTVKRGRSGTSAAAIGDDLFLLLIGSSYAEGTDAPSAVSRNPIKYFNYTQIFKNTYELTKTTDVTKFRTGDPWSNDKKRKMFDHARSVELAILFGQKSETTGDNGKPLRTMGGLRQFIPSGNQYVYATGTGTTWFDLIDRISPVFDYTSPAGDQRAAFVGNGALNALNKVFAADSSSEIKWEGVTRVFGMNFRELVMPQGRLLLRTHPLMSRNTLYTNSMFVLDMSSLNYVTLPGRDTKMKDDIQDAGEDLRRGFIQTESSLMVDRGGVTNAYIGGIKYSP
jgi:hypothetical protein